MQRTGMGWLRDQTGKAENASGELQKESLPSSSWSWSGRAGGEGGQTSPAEVQRGRISASGR